jgi:hypothetical protein
MGFLPESLEVGGTSIQTRCDYVTPLACLLGKRTDEIGIRLLFTHGLPSPKDCCDWTYSPVLADIVAGQAICCTLASANSPRGNGSDLV